MIISTPLEASSVAAGEHRPEYSGTKKQQLTLAREKSKPPFSILYLLGSRNACPHERLQVLQLINAHELRHLRA